MKKYIYADKLIAEIRKLLIPTVHDRDYDEWEHGRDSGFIQAISIIESLQQEQTPTEREIAEAHRYAEMIREKDKARIQQEQPEVDVKKELHAYICSDEYMNTREDGSLLIARHFYELGLRRAAKMYDGIEYSRQRAEED